LEASFESVCCSLQFRRKPDQSLVFVLLVTLQSRCAVSDAWVSYLSEILIRVKVLLQRQVSGCLQPDDAFCCLSPVCWDCQRMRIVPAFHHTYKKTAAYETQYARIATTHGLTRQLLQCTRPPAVQPVLPKWEQFTAHVALAFAIALLASSTHLIAANLESMGKQIVENVVLQQKVLCWNSILELCFWQSFLPQ
jgi:hypothetical protein